jgi:hypothetical protein
MFFVEDINVTVKCRTASKECLPLMLDNFTCLFTTISFLTKSIKSPQFPNVVYNLYGRLTKTNSILFKTFDLIDMVCRIHIHIIAGSNIDIAHHDTLAAKALTETVSMEEAVSKALELTNEKETLIIVTGDHSHVFSMGGYNYRGNDILGNVFVVVNSILFVVCQCS